MNTGTKRAWQLLLQHLDEVQRQQVEKHGMFLVRSPPGISHLITVSDGMVFTPLRWTFYGYGPDSDQELAPSTRWVQRGIYFVMPTVRLDTLGCHCQHCVSARAFRNADENPERWIRTCPEDLALAIKILIETNERGVNGIACRLAEYELVQTSNGRLLFRRL